MIPIADAHHMRKVSLFRGLDEMAYAAIAQNARAHHIPHDTFVFHQGDIASAFYVVLSGRIRLSQVTPEGNQVILGFIGPTDGVGIVAVIPQAEYPLSAQTVIDCTLLSWESKTLIALMERYPIIALRVLRMIAGRFVELQNQYRELATERVERRIARALLRLVRHMGQHVEGGVLIDIPLSRQDLAEMTGTTLYTVSRTLSRWEQQGILETGRERVVILSAEHLVKIAEDG